MNQIINRKWWSAYKMDIGYSLFIMVAGTLLHFVYEWSGKNAFVALFSAVNESVWEHLKLFFVPAFFFSLLMYYRIGEKKPDYLWYQTKSILAGLLLIVTAYYTITGITQKENVWVDIGIFYGAAVVAGYIGAAARRKDEQGKRKENKMGVRRYAAMILLILWALFVGFTYHQPLLVLKWFPGLFVG
ncbi:MAG: DUF6512 family protein [Lachnospiraceae bacterium]